MINPQRGRYPATDLMHDVRFRDVVDLSNVPVAFDLNGKVGVGGRVRVTLMALSPQYR